MSHLAPIYTIYGRLYTTFGLGGRHTGQPNGLPVGSTANVIGEAPWRKRRVVSSSPFPNKDCLEKGMRICRHLI